MQDLTDRLGRLGRHAGSSAAPSNTVIAADIRRGEGALRRRHVQRGAVGIAGLAAAAAVVTVAVVETSPGSAGHTASGTTPAVVSKAAIELVAYHGPQRAGFTVESVPDGYVLQGVSASTLDIAEPTDHSSLDIFSGKLTVGIEQVSRGQGLNSYDGKPVTINGEPGVISTDKTATTLIYKQGHASDNIVTVQSWSNINLTRSQVVDFAQGVTVTAAAQRQHG